MVVDCHVHFRDFNESHKETIAHGLLVARDNGVSGVFDMPNTKPSVFTEETALERLAIAQSAGVTGVFYGTYMGLTKNLEQVMKAVDVWSRHFPRVVGLKLYAGHSTNDLGIIRPEDQFAIYQTLAREGFNGVLAVHSEKETSLDSTLWKPAKPISHCMARPAYAEIDSVDDQIRFAQQAGFNGKLHIVHISTPRAVDLVKIAKSSGMDISCGITPHHLIYDWTRMHGSDGLLYKMNPALRRPGTPDEMLHRLRTGEIDWIETDHAPHTRKEKTEAPFLSGIPGLSAWGLVKSYLEQHGFTSNQIQEVTHNAVCRRFGIAIDDSNVFTEDHRGDYDFDPWLGARKMINVE